MKQDDSQNNQATTPATHAPAEAPQAPQQQPQSQPEQQERQQAKKTHKNLDKTKHRALEALVGLMPQLNNLAPEQRFKICIEAIRFTDNENLIDAALDAALAIEEPETQANALLEVVAEINYLEQQN